MIKKIVLLLILSFAFTANAQFGNGQRNGQRQQRQGPMTPSAQKAPKPNFKVEKYIGIVVYDVKKAAKKSRIRSSGFVFANVSNRPKSLLGFGPSK